MWNEWCDKFYVSVCVDCLVVIGEDERRARRRSTVIRFGVMMSVWVVRIVLWLLLLKLWFLYGDDVNEFFVRLCVIVLIECAERASRRDYYATSARASEWVSGCVCVLFVYIVLLCNSVLFLVFWVFWCVDFFCCYCCFRFSRRGARFRRYRFFYRAFCLICFYCFF